MRNKKKPRPRLAFPVLTDPRQAWRYLKVIRRSREARAVCEWLRTHPGPTSRCSPETLLLAMFLAAEILGRYYRSDLCAIINGLDAVIAYELGLCDDKTFKPISYNTVEAQILRLEGCPFGRILANLDPRDGRGPDKPCARNDTASADDGTPEADDNAEIVAAGLRRFNMALLVASIPKRALAKIQHASLDATAFPTAGRVRDYRVQAEVDKAIKEAIERGDLNPVPKGVVLGRDGKLQRCDWDPAARGAYRTGSAETGHKGEFFTGYFATLLCAARGYRRLRDPSKIHLRYDIRPYVLALSVDPATDNRAPVAKDLCLALKQLHSPFRTVTADREFSVRPDLVEALHAACIDLIMDYPKPVTQMIKPVTVGHREESLYQFCGDFFPLALPEKYKKPPSPNLTDKQTRQWHEDLSRYRYIPNGPPYNGGTRQFLCPQCAGNVRLAANTRMGKHRHQHHPAVSLGPPFDQEWCCGGSISISAEDLNRWQPVPWGTGAHKQLYAAGRNRIENANKILKEDGGVSRKACRAPRVPPHSMAVLALAVASNVAFADEDPLADPEPNDAAEAELTLLCVLPAASSGDDANTHTGPQADLPLRAPP